MSLSVLRRCWLCWCVLFVSVVFAQGAGATDRFFPDRVVLSPNRTVRLEAKSPDNVDRRPFARAFVYTLRDVASDAVRWTHAQAEDEGSPMELVVSDRGDVAAIVAGEELLLLSGRDGTARRGPRILSSMSEEESRTFVSETTAGPLWRDLSVFLFFDTASASAAGDGHYVGLRTFWERRLVFDLANGALVDIGSAGRDPAATPKDARQAAIVAALLAAESSWVKDVIGYAAKHDPYSTLRGGDYRSFHALRSAVHVAGCRRLKELLPQLRALEAATSPQSDGVESLRAMVHLSLRRMGELPMLPTGRTLVPYRATESGWVPDREAAIATAIPFRDRAARSASIKEGMSIEEVGSLIGPPDAEFYDATLGAHCVDWDLDRATDAAADAAPASTLRIEFDLNTNRVKAIRRFTPALWMSGYEREMGRLASP